MESIEDKNMRTSEELIGELCELILTFEDGLVIDKGIEYIDSLSEDEKNKLTDLQKNERKNIIQVIVQKQVLSYIEKYEEICEKDPSKRGKLFAFDNGSSLEDFCSEFYSYYLKHPCADEGFISFPRIFTNVFTYIEEMSDHFRIFEKFYDIRVTESLTKASDDAKDIVNKYIETHIADIVNKAIKKAEAKAKEVENKVINVEEKVNTAVDAAKKAADEASGAAKSAVKEKMLDVHKSVSETSVNILGIFAGIVLTVFAGLFYSAAVLENISNTNFCILITASALVGFVCFNLLAIMFTYIERFRSDNTKVGKKFSHLFWAVNFILVLIFIVFGILSYSEKSADKVDENTEVCVHVDYSTTLEDTESTDDVICE